MIKITLNFIVLFFCLQLSAQENIGKTSQGLVAVESGLWPSPTCNVCWENPSNNNANKRSWVRDAVRMTWEKESNFRFTGWGTCNANSKGIRIKISDEWPHVKDLGTGIDGLKDGMVLNFTFKNWAASACQSDIEGCIRKIAVHEFGHALGFAHEQNRTDAPLECQKDAQATDGDWFVTRYDEQSIMNYCNPKWNNEGLLSDRDIFGVRLLYGGRYVDDPIIYLINKSSDLLWYKHSGYTTAAPKWDQNTGRTVSKGWRNFKNVINNGDGFVYAVNKNGDLVWFDHTGLHDGTPNWSQKSGQVVYKGFWTKGTVGMFGGGKGIIYKITEDGVLIWYKHLGYHDGSSKWQGLYGIQVGSGWENFHAIFSGGEGIIYRIEKDGSLYWYNHLGYKDGKNSWRGGTSNKIATGWNTSRDVFSTGSGNIYFMDKSGGLHYYRHDGVLNGSANWRKGSGSVVAAGWKDYSIVALGSVDQVFKLNVPLQIVESHVPRKLEKEDIQVEMVKDSNSIPPLIQERKQGAPQPAPPVEIKVNKDILNRQKITPQQKSPAANKKVIEQKQIIKK